MGNNNNNLYNNWSDPANWFNTTGTSVFPGADVAAVFGGGTGTSQAILWGNGFVGSLSFSSGFSGLWAQASGSQLNLGSANTPAHISQNSPDYVVIQTDVFCASSTCTLDGSGSGGVTMIGWLLNSPALIVNNADYRISLPYMIGSLPLNGIDVNGGSLAIVVTNNVNVNISGAVNVNGGTLRLCNEGVLGVSFSASVINVNSGVFYCSASLIGSVNINGTAILNAGCSPGTLSITGDLTLGSTVSLNFELATPGVVGSGVNDLIDVTGDVFLDGTINVTALPGFGVGTYRLFNYTGFLTLSPSLMLGGVPPGYDCSLDTSAPGQMNLVVGPAQRPRITSQPQSLTVTQRQSATFVVEATGAEPLAFSWHLGCQSGDPTWPECQCPLALRPPASPCPTSNPANLVAATGSCFPTLTVRSRARWPCLRWGRVIRSTFRAATA